jgi:predicted outer membrane repeat protein
MNSTWTRATAVFALVMVMAPLTARAEPDAGVVGNGTPASCDSNALQTALNGGGLVTFNCGAAPHTIISNTYVISVNTIVDGANRITLDGEDLRQHFIVNAGAALTLRNLKLVKGTAAQGGSINNSGTLIVENVIFNGNNVPLASGYGGAINSTGVLTISGCAFTLNEARYGGAIFAGGSSVVGIANSSFIQNKAQLYGGGLYMNNDLSSVTIINTAFDKNTASFGAGVNRGGGTLTINHASFTDNAASHASIGGGGLYVESSPKLVKVTNATFSGNTTASVKGGGIYNRGPLELVNVTLKNNQNNLFTANVAGVKSDLRNTVLDTNGLTLNCDSGGVNVTTSGYNFANDNSCALSAPTDQKGPALNAMLGPLTSGFTKYFVPQAGSPLIDSAANCSTFDQRFALRVNACDRGAIEAGGLTARSLAPIAVK